MRDVKAEKNLAGDQYWPLIAGVNVQAKAPAPAIPEGANQEEAEEIVRSWQQVAVMKVTPDIEVYFGFKAGDHAQFLNVPVEKKNGLFGARVGDGDVTFFVIPKDMVSRPLLELVEVTSINNSKYKDIQVY